MQKPIKKRIELKLGRKCEICGEEVCIEVIGDKDVFVVETCDCDPNEKVERALNSGYVVPTEVEDYIQYLKVQTKALNKACEELSKFV